MSIAEFPLPAVDVAALLEAQRRRAEALRRTTAAQRRAKLRRIEQHLLKHRQRIRDAVYADFRKPPQEADLSELYAVVGEARHAIRHLGSWMRPRRVGTPLALLGSSSAVHYEPKGVVLIIAPWNFPFNLALGPLVSAIAAGNAAIIKPSELTPASSRCMAELIAEVFEPDEVTVVEGDASVARELLRHRFDHIFFTGSPAVGKHVMRAAAEHLTPVTLELGGKSPVIVDETADVREAAKKIAWGKSFNNGQVCVAPDYLLVHESKRDQFVDAFGAQLTKMYGEERAWQTTSDYARIVDERHHSRLTEWLEEAESRGAKSVVGGAREQESRFLAPTLVQGADEDSRLMQEEIFGPLLPMQTFRTFDEAIAIVNRREKPLVLYLFTDDRANVQRVLTETSSGGMCVNENLLHFFQWNLPFGGVGNSGVGKAHGFAGFETFSNARGVLRQHFAFSTIQLMFPPYSALKQKLIDLTVRYF